MTDTAKRPKIREILKAREIELHIVHDDTSLADVAKELGGTLGPLMNKGAQLVAPFAGILRDAYASRGMQSSAKKSATVDTSYEKAVAATAAAINRCRLDLQQMLDVDNGAYFEIALAASAAGSEGHLVIKVEDQADGQILISADSVIPGQLRAWGKQTSILENLFKAIQDYLKILPDSI